MQRIPSIFNDVLSPVTPGPSSSNTCGPYRIATLARCLLGETAKHLVIRMAADGGYSDTFYSMHSDAAFLAGLMGKELLTEHLRHAYEDAETAGLTWKFDFVDDLPLQPSELAELYLEGATRSIHLIGVSLGGGEIEITELNGQHVSLMGKTPCCVSFLPDGTVRVTPDEHGAGGRVVHLPAIYPFVPQERETPFHNAAEMFAYARKTKKPLWKIAFEYESLLTGAGEEQLRAYAARVRELCRQAAQRGRESGNSFVGITVPKAPAYSAALEQGKLISLGAADLGCLDAMSIMEYSNGNGTIVCMPTGGASGIIPAAIYRVGEALGKNEEEMTNALMVAGLIGVFYYETHYTGAIGCQAEIGVAISMAAAGLAVMLTDDPNVIEAAASMGGQSMLGLLCNPVEGYVQVPCIVRNMAAVPIAITCANAAVGGMDHVVPLDDVVQLMLEVGKKIRPCNRAGTYHLPEQEKNGDV